MELVQVHHDRIQILTLVINALQADYVLKDRKSTVDSEYKERTAVHVIPSYSLTPEAVASLQNKFKQVFSSGNQPVIKQYLNILLEKIIVDGNTFTVTGRTPGLLAIVENIDKIAVG